MSSLERISHASYLVEITDGLTVERDENRALFEHLKDGLHYLEKHGSSLRFLTSFELKLLRLAGYQPVLDRCKRCGVSSRHHSLARWTFSPADGGILCLPCAGSRKEVLSLGATAIEILAELQAETYELPTPVSLPLSVVQEMRSAVLRFIQYHMDKEIKSAPFLYQFSAVDSGAMPLFNKSMKNLN
jgi:DNA repair protein RecO (recombination protein O)